MTTLTPEETELARKALADMATKCDNAIDGIYETDPADWNYEFPEGLEEALATRRSTAQNLAERIHEQGSVGKEPVPLTSEDATVLADVLRELVADLEADVEREMVSGPRNNRFAESAFVGSCTH
ncbi:hypothetical protein [Arthrobacter rhombi]|uniref:hypothetical protein n=1 Tax=Arthrobacter rhombi TaxID=71253 RepID=UPI003FD19C18